MCKGKHLHLAKGGEVTLKGVPAWANLLTVSGSVLTEGFNLRSCCAQRQSTNNHLYKTLSQLDLPNIPYGSISYLTMTSGIRTVLPKW